MYDLITIALPYINGPIHTGHIYEMYHAYFIKKILLNYKNIKIYTGIDCHGLKEKYNINNIKKINNIKLKYFKLFIKLNNTLTFINKRISNWVFITLCDFNYIIGKINKKFYNEKKNFFIPDKYIRKVCKICKNDFLNTCKKCNTDMYKIYIKSSTKLIYIKNSINLYFKNNFIDDWDFSRVGKYNGFKIISKKITYFYVWYDALLSYISNNIKFFCKKNKILQFFGKDIHFFHVIFNLILKILKKNDTKMVSHGFIKKNEKKISKSNKSYSFKINKKYLKFYFLINLKNNIKDIKIEYEKVKENYKIYFFNKIINTFFRIRKILEKFDNRCSENLLIKKKHFFNFSIFKINIFIFIKKIIYNCDKINKIINLNNFWKKKNNFIKHIFYTNFTKKIINIINIFSNIFEWGKLFFFLNYKQFNLEKYEN